MSGFFWGALPYIAITVMVVGTIYRYWTGERGWTSKSSEFLAKDSLKVAGPMFHLGLVMALGGHVIGILSPRWRAASPLVCYFSAAFSCLCVVALTTHE